VNTLVFCVQSYDLEGRQKVALKFHTIKGVTTMARVSVMDEVRRECRIQSSFDHPCVVSLLDHFGIDENTYVTVMPFHSGRDLNSHLEHNKVGTAP